MEVSGCVEVLIVRRLLGKAADRDSVIISPVVSRPWTSLPAVSVAALKEEADEVHLFDSQPSD